MVKLDGQARPLAQFYVSGDVFPGEGIFEAAGDLILRQPVQQSGHVVFRAVHGEVVVNPETLRRHLLHGLGLIDDVFERRQVKLHPRVTLFRIGLHSSGHAVGVGTHRPRRHRYPGAVLLAEELVRRHASRLAHEVVHRRSQSERGLIADPVEGVRANVLVQHVLRFRARAFSQAKQATVGTHYVYRALRHVVIVDELVGPVLVVLEGDPVDVDVGNLHDPIYPFVSIRSFSSGRRIRRP